MSLAKQSAQPAEIVIIDGSNASDTKLLCESSFSGLNTKIAYYRANELGAATQRNQAIRHSSQDAILFFDDDILFEANCLEKLWEAFQSDSRIGGANAMTTNQQYGSPGLLSRSLFRLLHGKSLASYAGLCIGPAMNLLPEDRPDLPEIVPVEWLNLGCSLYRRKALPSPLFPPQFSGYSLMEDLTLSLQVGKHWRLVNARTARIFHDSQPGEHKSNPASLSCMELVNRHYVMTQVLGRKKTIDYVKLAILESFGIVTPLVSTESWSTLPAVLKGKLIAIGVILGNKRNGGMPTQSYPSSEAGRPMNSHSTTE